MEYSINRITPEFSGLGKIVTFSLLGTIASFGLFVLMGKLIENDNLSFAEPRDTFEFEILSVQEDKPTVKTSRTLPEPPKALTPPPPRPTPTDDTATELTFDTNIGFTIPSPQLGPMLMEGPRDNTAMPVVRVQPKYPMKAARDGLEGWVTLQFSINPVGQVTNIAVVDSKPSRIFDNEAKKALKKWKYKPQIKDGKAISVHNQQIMLEFKLGKS